MKPFKGLFVFLALALRTGLTYLFFLILLCPFLQFSQSPSFNFQKLGTEEGLNNANIFNIEQHQNGLMYFTTQNGIYYYDGYLFKQLRIDSLKSNTLLNVSIKNKDELYLSIRGEGIAEYKLKTKQLLFPPFFKLKNNADNVVVDEHFAYLLTSGIRLILIDLKTGQHIPDEVKQKDRMNPAYCIYKTKNGRILVGRGDGLYEVINGKQVKQNLAANLSVHSICESKLNEIVIGTSSKILVLKGSTVQSEIVPKYQTKSSTFSIAGEKTINKVISDEYGRIWFTSYPDENLYLYQNNKVYDVFEILGIPPSLINCLFKDTKNNLWIGTYNDGVYFIQNSFFNAVQFLHNNKNLNVNQVYLKDNLLVAATSNGLFGLNLTNNQTKILSEPDEIFMEAISSLVKVNEVIYYAKRSQFNMKPSLFFDSKNSYSLKPVIARQFYPINKTQSVIADWNANILLCNLDGTKTLDTLISFSDYRISVNALFKLSNSLYVATSSGLFKYDFTSKRHMNLVRDALNYNINDIALINGKLYAAHEAGITDVSENKLIQQIGPFRLNSVKKIKLFNDQVWLATLDGVLICDLSLKPLKILNKSAGLLSNSVNDISINANMVSIATARGIATTELKNIINYNTKPEAVSIDEVVCNGEVIEIKDKVYHLTSSQDNISIRFFSPIYNKPVKQYFKYKLNKEDWKEFNDLALNISLAGGKHKIAIAVSLDNIVWSENTEIRIEKNEKLTEKQALYWWMTFTALVLVVSISFIWIRRVKRIAKQRLQQEQQINELKHQAMNSLLSPHFIFNSLTSIQNYINTNESLRASEYLAKFSRLIRMIIEKASQREISLYDELARLTYYLELEKERFKNKFDYSIHIDESINTRLVNIPNMIIQPHVENCIIHGILPKHAPGSLSISFKKPNNKKLVIYIEDDGIGIIKSQEHIKEGHRSLGTSTIRNILDINSKLSGKKQIVSMVDRSTLDPKQQGTIITIEIEL